MFSKPCTRMTALLLILTISAFLIAGVAAASPGPDLLQQQAVESQERLARQAATSLESYFNQRRNELHVLTEVYGLGYLDATAQRDVLLTLLSAQPAYYELAVVKPDGQETIRVTRGKVITDDLTNRAGEVLFQTALETGEISFGSVYLDEESRDRLMTIAVPAEDIFTGQTGYVLLAEVRFQAVSDAVFRGLNLTENDDVYVLDSDAVVIAHRNPGLMTGETQYALTEGSGRQTGLRGDDVILGMAAVQLNNQTLTVVAERAYEKAIASPGTEALENQTVESQERLARQAATSLESYFNQRRNELHVLTEVYGLGYLDATAQRDVLLTLLSAQPAYYELAVVEPDGQETIRVTRGKVITDDLANRAGEVLFQTALATGEISFGSVYFDEESRDRLMTIAVPAEDIFTGETGYVLLAEVRFQAVSDAVFRSLTLTENDDVYVLNSDAVVIAHRNPGLMTGETQYALTEGSGRQTGLRGDDVILGMAAVQLGNQALTVVAERLTSATALNV